MTVCKYFQLGCCRFGSNCRYDHAYGSQYKYVAPTPQNQGGQSSVSDEQLVKQVHSDVQALLLGNQWLLSSYSPFKEKAMIPGITDLSPEEARLFIYEAKVNNNVDQAVAYMNNIMKETRFKYEQLLQAKPEIVKLLRKIYNGEPVNSPFSDAQINAFASSSNVASSLFRSAVQNKPAYVQNESSSVFGQNNAASSIFSQQNKENTAKSIFAQANQNVFGSSQNNIFEIDNRQTETSAKSLFAQANQHAFTQSNVFSSPNQAFTQKEEAPFKNDNIFKVTESSVFGTSKSVIKHDTSNNDNSNYSKIEDVSQDDLEQFRSDHFTLGFIPELPPPSSLCFG